MKKRVLFLISFFFLITFPAFYINVGINIRFSVILCFSILGFICFKDAKCFVNSLFRFLDNRIGRLLLAWFIYIILTSVFLCLNHTLIISELFRTIFFRIIPLIFTPFFLAYNINKYYQPKDIVKFYYIFLLTIFLIGFVEFLIYLFHINLLENIYEMTIINNRYLYLSGECQKAFAGMLPRMQSVFDEPSYLGLCICAHLPFLYNFYNFKYKIFKNKYFNAFIKKGMPFFAWAIIIATFSPISLVLAIVVTYIYFIFNKNNFILAITKLVIIIISFFIIMQIFKMIDFSGTFLERITKTMEGFGDMNEFVKMSPSLANRITHYINTFFVFLKHPFIGVGFGNLQEFLYEQFSISPVPLTEETLLCIKTNKHSVNASILSSSFAETGIIGTTILYSLLFLTLNKIKKCIKLSNSVYDFNICKSLLYTLSIYICCSVYDSRITDTLFWGIVGLSATICLTQTNSKNNTNLY